MFAPSTICFILVGATRQIKKNINILMKWKRLDLNMKLEKMCHCEDGNSLKIETRGQYELIS
jgi:hypothetical protein